MNLTSGEKYIAGKNAYGNDILIMIHVYAKLCVAIVINMYYIIIHMK
jgi:hypothetical protein